MRNRNRFLFGIRGAIKMQYSVDVILLTYKPGKQVMELIRALEEQTYPIRKIIIMNTEERYFYNLFYGTGFLEQYRNVEIHHLSEKEFDHGRTRAKAVQYSKSDIFVCMTQDAMPEDDRLIQNLVKALTGQEKTAAAYARQLPLPDCREIEDMVYAGHAVIAGYRIAYAAEAQVRHSHNYTCMQQFHRNFDLGVSQAEHPEVFNAVSSENEGIRLVRSTIRHLEKKKKWLQIPYLIVSSGYKLIGYQLGKHYRSLPKGMVKWCSASKSYWN